ncbi:hypothetical protein CVS27_00705 [Arthrobacter glacialis]|uniref:DUF11 domain-containing protein n=2 Tax=Arthrobacter glacialis TaxID=1664 RepID=A0A2S4A0X3_ARTGL|nr:hypothetical protein CVS27_00705 [Arthrobacter glacialis]
MISWFFGRKFGNRRRKLLFAWDAVQLIAGTSRAKGALEVSYGGTPVVDPYILQITLKNIGSADISSSHFDAMRNLEIVLPNGYLTVVDINSVDVEPDIDQIANRIRIKPVLLRRGARVSLDVLVDGNPEVQLDSPLQNTDIARIDPVARAAEAMNQSSDPLGFLVGFLMKVVKDALSR